MSTDTLEKPKTYYELLDVAANASDEDIKCAYRKLALQYHPDRPGIADRRTAELRFRLINEAYAHLKTPEKRAAYNNVLKAQNDNAHKNSLWARVIDMFRQPVSRH